jgi:integrase
MASLFRPIIIRYTLADGTRVSKETPGARPKKYKAKKWYGKLPGEKKPIPLSPNKTVAQQMLAQRLHKSENAKVGIVDPFEAHRKTPLATHLADFVADLRAKGTSGDRADLVRSRLQKIIDGCKFVYMADFSASRVEVLLADLRRDTETSRGLSIQTSNDYLSALKQFGNWLVKDRRAGENLFAHLSGGNVKLDRRHDRRAFTEDELRRILDAARTSPRRFRKLPGDER